MLKNKRQNYHHSKLPEIGTIVNNPVPSVQGKWIVKSFNLCDNVLPYSVGIHLVNVESLSNRNIQKTISGFYCLSD